MACKIEKSHIDYVGLTLVIMWENHVYVSGARSYKWLETCLQLNFNIASKKKKIEN